MAAPNWGLDDNADVSKIRPRRRGFAAMKPEAVRAISSKGGKAAHAHGTAHKWTSETARLAGKKGGVAPHRSRGRTVVDEEPITLHVPPREDEP